MSRLAALAAALILFSAPCFQPAAGFCEDEPGPLAGEEFTAEAYVQDALEAANKGVEVVFPYSPGSIYKVYLQAGFVTDIRLEAGEALKYAGAGDTSRWVIDTSTTGAAGRKVTHLYVKPSQDGISTNLVINTDRRSYQLLLVSGYHFNPIVSWSVPKSSMEFHADKVLKDYASINPKKIDFGYKVGGGSYKWAPELVFSSGHKVYMKMKSEIVDSELPALFILDDEGKMTLASYRFLKGYLVCDRLFDKAVLLLGRRKVYVKKRM